MGSSVDWERESFTMDDKLSVAVTEAFCRFHEKGLLYRATRLVNWSCALKSAISDIEVDYIDIEQPQKLAVPGHTAREKYEFGTLTHFAYRVKGSETGEELVVATTRLETMLGDVAVAVHPDDERYRHLHGQTLEHPFTGRDVVIITDSVLVDMEFGTGAVKITPAHDPNDFECGKRNNLEQINILNEDGTMNENAAEFKGMMRYDARIAVEKALDAKGLFRGKEPNKMRLGICSRSGDIIEPYLTPQWYVSCQGMADRAVDAVKKGELEIKPAFHEATWYRWLEDCHDWCVSRQLWWGHRIPAYFVQKKGEDLSMSDQENNARWFVGRTEGEARAKAAEALGVSPADLDVRQDPDVLDTWFSSGLFPFSVFGWPNQTEDLEAFYPTTLLETGMDILFFWVARMVMMGLELTDQLPFKTVFLHAMVRDKQGRKMSKSLGNVIDPLEIIYGCDLEQLLNKIRSGNLPKKEVDRAIDLQRKDFPKGIPQCGADALRFGLLSYMTQGRDINLDILRVVGYRGFCNKLWNATRFALTYVTEFKPSGADVSEAIGLAAKSSVPRDRWIMSRLHQAAAAADKNFCTYEFGDLSYCLYKFWLNDLCDNYLEAIKPVVNNTKPENEEARKLAQGCLYLCLDWGLRMLHPLMPFVTEDLWQRLPGRGTLGADEQPSIMIAPYPVADPSLIDPEVEANFEVVTKVVSAARAVKADYNLPAKVAPEVYVKVATAELKAMMEAQADDISTLAKVGSVSVFMSDGGEPPHGCSVVVVNDSISVHVHLTGYVDFAAELNKLQAHLEIKIEPYLAETEAKINAKGFENAPEKVRATTIAKRDELLSKKETALKAIQSFRELMED